MAFRTEIGWMDMTSLTTAFIAINSALVAVSSSKMPISGPGIEGRKTLAAGTSDSAGGDSQYLRVREDAERFGMPLIVWSYPRGAAIEAKGGLDSFYAVDYAARTASELGADLVLIAQLREILIEGTVRSSACGSTGWRPRPTTRSPRREREIPPNCAGTYAASTR